ncbi:MAG: preprotein translocase subunit SecE [Gammaproteobacteria bacterium]|nr:preprotein translocase subunit SecE [Gammaproteobacteria bacterium]
MDGLKWGIVLGLVVLGVLGNYTFSEQPLYLRVLGELLVGGIAAALAFQTGKGKKAWLFLGEARAELNKVIWSNRQETVRATLVVVGVVLIVVFFLWMLDAVLAKMAAWFIR